MRLNKILILLLLCCTASFAQDSIVKESKPFRFPVIGLGIGMMNFSGDIGYGHLNQPLIARSGFQIELQKPTENRMSIGIFLMSGKVFGEEKTVNRTVNFTSSILSEGIVIRYDFLSRKRSDQVLIPYLTAGVEYIFFRSKTDLMDANGNYYNYWSDGTIRDKAQDDPNAAQAVKLHRDYNYETDLREANPDGFAKYSTNTWGIPAGAGVQFKISPKVAFNLSSVYHFTGSDYIDGVTVESHGSRRGNERSDRFFFTSLSLRISLSMPDKGSSNIDFDALVNEDADKDGITDLADDSSGTPANNVVLQNGMPLDFDNDGIPDYRDQELSSASDAVVNEQGVTITEQMIEEKFLRDSLAALPSVVEYLKSYDKLTERNPEIEKKWGVYATPVKGSKVKDPVPPLYRDIDVDQNGVISPKEISKAIDAYVNKKSTYTSAEFFDLIDYFFSQK